MCLNSSPLLESIATTNVSEIQESLRALCALFKNPKIQWELEWCSKDIDWEDWKGCTMHIHYCVTNSTLLPLRYIHTLCRTCIPKLGNQSVTDNCQRSWFDNNTQTAAACTHHQMCTLWYQFCNTEMCVGCLYYPILHENRSLQRNRGNSSSFPAVRY